MFSSLALGSISPHRSWLARPQVLPRLGNCMQSNHRMYKSVLLWRILNCGQFNPSPPNDLCIELFQSQTVCSNAAEKNPDTLDPWLSQFIKY